jgi:hypothetical protein
MRGAALVTLLSMVVAATAYADDKQAAEFVFAGMLQARQAIRSGVCRIEGHKFVKSASKEEATFDGDLKIFLAFDGDTKLRFDRTQPDWVLDESTAREDPKVPGGAIAQTKRGVSTRKYFRNGEKSGGWSLTDSPFITLSPSKPPPEGWGYVDPRGLGLYTSPDYRLSQDFAKLFEKWRNLRPTRIDRSNPRIWVIVWNVTAGTATGEDHMSINVEEGFTPVHYQAWETRGGSPKQLTQETTTEWTVLNGVYVPTRHTAWFQPVTRQWVEQFSFDIKWDKFNKPIEERIFDYKDFEAPGNVGVIDATLGEPIMIKDFQLLSEFNRGRTTRLLLWSGFAGLIVACVTVASLYVRRRIKARSA